MTIPTWNEAKRQETPLDRFVYNHEPIDVAANEWRADLAALLSYILAKAPSEKEIKYDDQGQTVLEFTD